MAGTSVAPGETARFFVDVAKTIAGSSRVLDVFVVVTRGVKPGPTLCLTAGIHGDELNGVEIAHRIYAATPGSALAGTLIAVPVANIQGFRSGARYLPDRRDLNRAFPGSAKGSLASRIAHQLYQGVIRHCDALIDLHTGSASRTNLPQIRTDLGDPKALALARSFGVGVVLSGRGPRGSLRRAVLDAGRPAVIYEAGEPLRFEEEEIAGGVEGVQNVMGDLGMIERKAKRQPSEVYRKTTWVRSGDAIGVFLTRAKAGRLRAEGRRARHGDRSRDRGVRDDRRAARRPHHRDGGAPAGPPGLRPVPPGIRSRVSRRRAPITIAILLRLRGSPWGLASSRFWSTTRSAGER